MKEVKEWKYDKNTSWQGYSSYVKENIGRELLDSEYKSMMQSYINKISPEEWIEENR